MQLTVTLVKVRGSMCCALNLTFAAQKANMMLLERLLAMLHMSDPTFPCYCSHAVAVMLMGGGWHTRLTLCSELFNQQCLFL